jgi:hypothetical protein
MAKTPAPRRDLEIWGLRKKGLGVTDIGRRLGISKQLAHLAFRRTERILQGDSLGGSIFLTSRSRKAIRFLTGSESPSLPDLRQAMIGLNERAGSWAGHLLSEKGYGPRTVAEITLFSRECGIEEGIISPAKEEKRWERSEPPPESDRISESHVLAVKLGPRAMGALEAILGDYPTFSDLKDFVEGNPGWREGLLGLKNCGRTTVREIEDFARKNGMKC